jgi:hypothetical protein
MKRKLFLIFSLIAIVAIAFTSCQKDSEIIDQIDVASVKTTSVGGVVPVLHETGTGGNVECDTDTYEHTSGRINYQDGQFDADFPAGFTVTVTDGIYVAWSYTPVDGMCLDGIVVIVKGGPAANVYTYEAGINEDSGLASPANPGGNIADLSNLTFCYNLVPCEEEECWKGETAWGGDLAGGGPAWWFYYATSGEVEQAIYAGQELVEGAYVKVVDGMMTIVLGENMRLDPEASEPVKVQGYNTIPNRRPASGLFTTYKGTELEFEVPHFAFYAIHLDVEVKVECPEGEE